VKKHIPLICLCFIALLLTSCGFGGKGEFKADKEIAVFSREDGSGTRTAFTEIFNIVEMGENGTRKDRTTKEAVIAKQTDVLMSGIASDRYSIGYLSLGSVNKTIKLISIDGVYPTAETVKNGTYAVSRPFIIVTKKEISPATQDFINFMLSKEGQAVAAESYISAVDNAPEFNSSMPSGKVVVAGSSSVTPVMEKLKEAYIEINPNAIIEIQLSDSSSGIQGVIDGTCDIGMSSRHLKDSEKAVLDQHTIALDGIAIVVNKNNPINNLSSEQVKAVFKGEITRWRELIEQG